MNFQRVLLTVVAILLAIGSTAQIPNRTDLCQNIPNLTPEQQQKIDKLSATHQKTMDGLRTQFHTGRDGVIASGYKTQMNAEMLNHYNNISGILTTDQQTWFDQTCNVNSKRGNSYTAGLGRGQGFRRGQGYGRGQSFRRGQGYGRGQARLNY